MTLMVLLIGAGLYHTLKSQDEPVETAAEPEGQRRQVVVRQFSSHQTGPEIPIDGRLKTFAQVNFPATVSGRLLPTSIAVKKGVRVRKGTLLFEIDQTKARYNLQAQRSSLMNAITLIMPDIKVDHPQAFSTWKTYIDRFDAEAVTEPLPPVADEQLKLFIASRNLYQLYYNIKSGEATLEEYRIYAPFSGEIVESNLSPGAMVTPGQMLGSLINTSLFELEATVPEADLPFIKVGDKVDLQPGYAAGSRTGRVARIGSRIDPVTQYVPVFIQVRGEGLKDGAFVSGVIHTQPRGELAKIDRRLVVDGEAVFTVRDSVVRKSPIHIMRSDAEYIYAREHDPALWVVVSDVAGLAEGQTVFVSRQTDSK